MTGIATITMPPLEARERLREYRRSRHKDVEGEYALAVAGYEALAKGQELVNIGDVIPKGGFLTPGMPRLAICRADAKVVRYHMPGYQMLGIYTYHRSPHRDDPKVEIRMSRPVSMEWGSSITGYAMVPMVPPDMRPERGRLALFHILWEVTEWFRSDPTTPPGDPYLLRHIQGNLYTIISQWDLTELERAVMTHRTPQ